MGDIVNRKALMDYLKDKQDLLLKDLDIEYMHGASDHIGTVIKFVESLPSTESEGEADDGWRVCPACGEDYRNGEDVIVGSGEDKLRAENERLRAVFKRIETELSDDPSPRAQWVVAVIDEALKEGEGARTMSEWIDGVPPDMGDQDAVWIVAEIPAFFGSKLVRYETFVWYADRGRWTDKGVLHRASRWMMLVLPTAEEGEGK